MGNERNESGRRDGSTLSAAAFVAGLLLLLATAKPALADGAGQPLGGNVNSQASWTADFAFVNAATTAGEPKLLDPGGSLRLDSPAPLDARGWPKTDFGVYVNEAAPQPGTYAVTGRCAKRPSVDLVLTPGTVGRIIWDSRRRAFRAMVTVASQGEPGTDGRFILSFRGTGGGVRDLSVTRPGYGPYRHPVFTSQYVDFLKAHRPTVLRTMDLTQTNDSVVSRWSERTLPGRWGRRTITRTVPVDWSPGSERISSERGMAWEYAIDLCNAVGSDCWLNIPLQADDDYVRRLASLVKSRLSTRLDVWVEYSNELWNDGFSQAHVNRRLAASDRAARRGRLDYDGSTDPVALGDRRVAARAVAIGAIFKRAFGRAAARVKPVLAYQYANPDRTRDQLAYLERVHGPPRNHLSALAVAPYVNLGFSPGGESLDVPGLDSARVLSLLEADMEAFAASSLMGAWKTRAERHRLQLVAYEGGPDTFGENNVDAKTAATLDPRMQGLVERYLKAWFAAGGGQFNWYTLGADPYGHRFGTWSISDSIARTDSPKSRGFIAVRNGG